MKKSIIIIALMLIPKIGMAQLDFKIENVIVSRIIEELGMRMPEERDYRLLEGLLEDGEYITEIITIIGTDFGSGPLIRVFCSITNNSDETVVLCRSSYEIEVIFIFDGTQYSRQPFFEMFTPPILANKRSLTILPNQTLLFDFYHYYLFGTDFFKWDRVPMDVRRIDHTKEVIATLPTLRVRYRDRNIDITTSEIRNVTVENILYVYE
jgi:hypothetical protein